MRVDKRKNGGTEETKETRYTTTTITAWGTSQPTRSAKGATCEWVTNKGNAVELAEKHRKERNAAAEVEAKQAKERYENSFTYLIPLAFRLTPLWVKLLIGILVPFIVTLLNLR